MTAWRRLISAYRGLIGGERLERDLDDEVRAYVDQRIDELVATGVGPAEARRRILAEEGGLEPVKELARSARAGHVIATVGRDLRIGWRSMRRSPGFTGVACITLALGIGASIGTFTVMRSVLWRPLPYPDADRIVAVEVDARGVRNAGASMAEVRDLRVRSRTLTHVAAVNAVGAHVDVGGQVDGLAAVSVSDDFLPALGIVPALGRPLSASIDNVTPAARGVLLSHEFWRRRLGANPAAVGWWIVVNNTPREVVGILPAGLKLYLPESIGAVEQTDVWFSTGLGENRTDRGLGVVARLTRGHTAADAQRELDALVASLATEHPSVYASAPIVFRVREVREALTAPVRSGLAILGWAVAFVLLVGTVNVANLLLARGAGRTREMAVRRALGASPARIVRQVLTENLLLAAIASAHGLLLARWTVVALDWLRPTHLPRQGDIAMDGTVAAFAVGLTVVATILFGVLPALRLAGGDRALPGGGRSDTAGRGARRLQRMLVVAEIALSIVPLVAAGLMLRSFVNLTHAPIGVRPDHVVTAHVPMSFRQFGDVDTRWRLHAEAFARLRATPGVEAVSAVSPVPFGPNQYTRRYSRSGDGAPNALAAMQTVFPGYFAVVGTRLVAGRDFSDDDLRVKAPVVIVDARIANALWPTGAVGQRLAVGSGSRVTDLTVIGVTEPVRTRHVRDDQTPHVFLPYHLYSPEMTLVVRTAMAADAIAPTIRSTIRALGTGRAVDVRPMTEFVRDSMAETRFVMLVLTGFAGASLALAVIGLYGTLAYLVAQRAREFTLRQALGATRAHIMRLVAAEGLRLTMVGVALGGAGAIGVALAMRQFLYEVVPLDPLTLATTLALVGGLAFVACLKPAWTASRANVALDIR